MALRKRYRYQLTKYEKNDLFRAIEGSSVPVAGFGLSEKRVKLFAVSSGFLGRNFGMGSRSSRTVTIIRHRGTSSVFGVIRTQYDRFKVQHGAGGRGPESMVLHEWVTTANDDVEWLDVVGSAGNWAGQIRGLLDESMMPDLWEKLKHDRDFLTGQASPDIENTPFTATEQSEVSGHLRQIKNNLNNIPELTSAQVSEIGIRLEHLEEASERVGRKDWLMMFNGAIASLILSDLLPPQIAEHIIVMAIQGLAHLFGIGGLPHLLTGD